MLSISCPWCGPRDEPEFVCGGPADVARPGDPDAASDAEWAAYLYFRRNPRGRTLERWLHAAGCRRWFLVERDTVTHEILRIRTLDGSEGAAAEEGGR